MPQRLKNSYTVQHLTSVNKKEPFQKTSAAAIIEGRAFALYNLLMRILMFGISPGFGGTEAVIYSMLKTFKANNIDVDFINTFQKPLANETELRSMGSNILALNLRKRWRYIAYRREVNRFFKTHANLYDAIWINVQEPECGNILRIAKSIKIEKRLVLSHNAASPSGATLLRKASLFFSKRQIIKYATHKVAVSPLAGRFVFGTRYQFKFVRSGIDIDRFKFSPDVRRAMRASLGIPDRCYVYLFAGRIEEQKNPEFALSVIFEILSAKDDSMGIFLGDGSLSDDLEKAAHKSKYMGRLIFVHNITDISPYLCASDFYIFPSLYEGMGMSLIEAQCSGIPCFASDGTVPKEAKVSDLVHWLPLNKGAQFWANYILRVPPNADRASAYRPLIQAGLDSSSVAQQYIKILLE